MLCKLPPTSQHENVHCFYLFILMFDSNSQWQKVLCGKQFAEKIEIVYLVLQIAIL